LQQTQLSQAALTQYQTSEVWSARLWQPTPLGVSQSSTHLDHEQYTNLTYPLLHEHVRTRCINTLWGMHAQCTAAGDGDGLRATPRSEKATAPAAPGPAKHPLAVLHYCLALNLRNLLYLAPAGPLCGSLRTPTISGHLQELQACLSMLRSCL
jgi:hypothetical protein